METYKFDPLKHGYEPVLNFPELSYAFPMTGDWFIKVICYTEAGGLVYWFSATHIKIGLSGDDRVKILSGCYDSRKKDRPENQLAIQTDYCGLISSDAFATELLKHIFGTLHNCSVEKEGVERYTENVAEKMRKEFNLKLV